MSIMRAFFPATLYLLTLLLLIGCSEDPNSTGIDFMDRLTLDSIQSVATFDTTILTRLPGTSTTLLTGRYQDYEARSLIEFALPLFDAGTTLDSAVVIFNINYRFKDSSGQYGFSAHSMTRSWAPQTFTWDSIPGTSDPSSSGSFIGTVSSSDSTLRFRLDTLLIRQWSQAGSGSMMLVPSLTAGMILGFSNAATVSADLRPELVVSYHDTADTTIELRRRSSRASFVANADFPAQAGRFYVSAAIGYRGIIRFDSLAVPLNASITQAVLEVTVDPAGSLTNAFTRDSLIVYLMRKNVSPFDSLALGLVCQPVVVGPQKVFRADIRSIVQLWTTGREKNYGLLFRPYGEFTTIDRFSLYGIDGPPGLQPKLTITYTVVP